MRWLVTSYIVWLSWAFSYEKIMNPVFQSDLRKPFYVSVSTHRSHESHTCMGGRFVPVNPDYYFFHFFSFSMHNYKLYDGVLLKMPLWNECFLVMTEEGSSHTNLTLCFRNHDENYHYIYITDLYNTTGLGLVDSVNNITLQETLYEIMQAHHTHAYRMDTSYCTIV